MSSTVIQILRMLCFSLESIQGRWFMYVKIANHNGVVERGLKSEGMQIPPGATSE